MKIFDFNIHLPWVQSSNVNQIIDQDMGLSVEELCQGFQIHNDIFENLSGANFMLFNQELLKHNIQFFYKLCSDKFEHTLLTALINYSKPDILDYIRQACSEGIRAIMFNSYLQKITELDYKKVLQVCKFAEAQNMLICIDASYGTTQMYCYDNLKLACFIADVISNTPIVIIHSGGCRLIEAMLIALDKTNIYLDTSFSLPFYIGSSIEKDFAFAYKKIGSHRILFGSDHPYVNFDSALKQHFEFFEKYRFLDSDVENIMYNTAINLLNGSY